MILYLKNISFNITIFYITMLSINFFLRKKALYNHKYFFYILFIFMLQNSIFFLFSLGIVLFIKSCFSINQFKKKELSTFYYFLWIIPFSTILLIHYLFFLLFLHLCESLNCSQQKLCNNILLFLFLFFLLLYFLFLFFLQGF